MRSDIEKLMKEAKSKIDHCGKSVNNLDSSLTELQNQHDTARDLIEESFQSFKAVLEKCRDNSLKELEKLHSERELKIMDVMHNVEKSVEKIENAYKFTTRVLKQSNAAELLSLKKMISTQFLNLLNNTPKVDINYSLEFDTKFEKFEKLAIDTYGKFITETSPPSPKESTPPPTLPGMPPILISKNHAQNSNGSSSQGALTGSVTASSPISLPTSMQSSFDGDMSALGTGFMLPPNVLTPDSPSQSIVNPISDVPVNAVVGSAPLHGLSSMAEYNIHRLATLTQANDMPDSIVPPHNPSPSPQFTLADLISGDQHAFNNFQALAKMGLNGTGILVKI